MSRTDSPTKPLPESSVGTSRNLAHNGPPAILAIIGATGTGKSDLSLDLADALLARGARAEIVNADAMQLYRGMDIGTAKLPVEERRRHPHHLLDVLDVTEESTVASYQPAARATIDAIRARGAVPILVGGSGLYVSSVLYDFAFPARDPGVRERLEGEFDRDGLRAMYERLRALDPVTAERVGPHNGRRIVRALEVLEVSGTSAPAMLPDAPRLWCSGTLVLGLRMPREDLVPRLDERVLTMWRLGLLDEVRALLDRGLAEGPTASRAIGYAQAAAELAGLVSREEAIGQAQALTRRYARRQVSWFRRYADVRWIDALDPADRRAAVLAALGN